MKRTISILLIVLCACAYSVPALSWGQEGHRIIAKIAYDHLNKKSRKDLDQGIEDIHVDGDAPQKVIIDGVIYILRGERIFTVDGQEIR